MSTYIAKLCRLSGGAGQEIIFASGKHDGRTVKADRTASMQHLLRIFSENG
jgi:hypothetical protein